MPTPSADVAHHRVNPLQTKFLHSSGATLDDSQILNGCWRLSIYENRKNLCDTDTVILTYVYMNGFLGTQSHLKMALI